MKDKYYETEEEACPTELESLGWTGLTILLLPAAVVGSLVWLLF